MDRIFKILLLIGFCIFLGSCKQASPIQEESELISELFPLPTWAQSANIYEVNIRQYTEEGTINAFTTHLPRLKKMGVDILWFMPIYPISTTKKKGTLGSYYAVSNFLEVNPAFGSMQDMEKLIDQIHALDMHIILDWVPNHTGWDHHWIQDHPDWYTQDLQGNIVDPQNDQGESFGWTDVADLNYDSKEMQAEMIRQLKWWLEVMHIDGYRMDIAFGVPNDFWASAQKALSAERELFMLAESETPEHRNQGYFHANYGWSLFHAMNDVAKGSKSVDEFKQIHVKNQGQYSEGNSLYFCSNHDENSWNGTVFERLGDAAQGWAVVKGLLDGIPLLYSGMEEPMRKRLEFFEKDTIGFKQYAYQDFYTKLFTIKKEYTALHNLPYGSPVKWLESKPNILRFERKNQEHAIQVYFNPKEQSEQIVIPENATALLTNQVKPLNTVLGPSEYLVIRLNP